MTDKGATKVRDLVYDQVDPIIGTRVRIKHLRDDINQKRLALGHAVAKLEEAIKEEESEFKALIYLIGISDIDVTPEDTNPSLLSKLHVVRNDDDYTQREFLDIAHPLMKDIQNAIHGNPNKE